MRHLAVAVSTAAAITACAGGPKVERDQSIEQLVEFGRLTEPEARCVLAELETSDLPRTKLIGKRALEVADVDTIHAATAECGISPG